MKRVSVELIPRDEETLRGELTLLQKYEGKIDVINIPDLLRFDIRSWEGSAMAQEYFPMSMPHIRAMDIDLDKELPMKDYLREKGIKEVLVVQGDPPQRMTHEVYPTEKVYAGIDQYRSSMRHELYRTRRKVQAGAAGFFTQPFFDMRMLEIYMDMLDGLDVYWGVSPVVTAASQSYWERKNNVIFPKNFAPTLEWSVDFSRQVMEMADKQEANVYLMPIKTNLEEYLAGVFA